jgi:hypothetical protein
MKNVVISPFSFEWRTVALHHIPIFQLDDAPPRISHHVYALLDREVPDLTPVGFFFWGFAKDIITEKCKM